MFSKFKNLENYRNVFTNLIETDVFYNPDLVIGIYGNLKNNTDYSVSQSLPYLAFAGLFGNVVILPYNASVEICNKLDALIIPGGADVNPVRYSAKRHIRTQNSNDAYEQLDITIATEMINRNKPVFGICRGFQTINVILGGSLEQHVEGHMENKECSCLVQHNYIPENTDSKFEYYFHTINSRHHQAVTKQRLSTELKGIAFDYTIIKQGNTNKYITGDIIEAFISNNGLVAGVQWHPEDIHDSVALYLMYTILSNYYTNTIKLCAD